MSLFFFSSLSGKIFLSILFTNFFYEIYTSNFILYVPILDYETIILPLLKFSSDSNEHSPKETIKSLSDHFK